MPSVHDGLLHHLFANAPRHPAHLRPTHVGASFTNVDSADPTSSSSSAMQGQTNYTPSSPNSSPGSVAGSLLGDLGGLLGGGTAPSTAVLAATSASNTPTTYVAAPDQLNTVGPTSTPASGGGSTPAPASPSAIIPAPTTPAKSNLIWWIVGGVAAAGVILLAWRMFGHKGAIIAGSGAAKAAAYAAWMR